MSESPNRHVGFFIVPAEHLGELHALEAAASEAGDRYDDPQHLDWWAYHVTQAFERAVEVASIATVIKDSKYMDAYGALGTWFQHCICNGRDRNILDPNERAAMARELEDIRAEDMIRWVRKHRIVPRKTEPLVIDLFEAMVRTVTAASTSPSGFAMLLWYEKHRHPPEPPPPRPAPEPPPPDEDEGALMGWFTVPAEHIPALQAIDAERDAAFRQGRMADFYALETRLFERARAVARSAEVFNAWDYKAAYRAWCGWLAKGENGPLVPAVRDVEEHAYWVRWLKHPRGIPDLPPAMDDEEENASEEGRARIRELAQALRRVADARRARNCGLVIAWCFAQPPTWPRYDDASRRMAWMRMLELDAVVDRARAGLAAIEARRRRARPKATDSAKDSAKDSANDSANHAGRDAAPDAARDAVHDAAAVDEAATRAQSEDQTEAQSEAQADLARRFPWLSRLPEHVLATLARHIARAQPARVPIALTALLAEDFFAVDTSVDTAVDTSGNTAGEPEIERAGRRAMAEAMARHPAWVALTLPGRGKPDVRVYLDGQRLQVHEGGVSADAFFARGGGALLDVQAAWHQGMLDASIDQLQPLYDTYPPLYAELITERFEKMVSDSVMKRLDRQDRAEARKKRAKARRARS